jgi:hypothetical protein
MATPPGWYYGFICAKCGRGVPVERSDGAEVESGVTPVSVVVWKLTCDFCKHRDVYGGSGVRMTRVHVGGASES